MFDWLRHVFRRSEGGERQRFFAKLDALNAEAGGGVPVTNRAFLGRLKLRSGTIVLGDPQCPLDLEIPKVAAEEVEISALLWRYPSGAEAVAALNLGLGERAGGGARRKIGEIGVDSAKLVVADKADIEEHWTETGKDRIGVISTAPDETVLRLLTKRFNLKTIRVNPVRTEVVGPVSEQLAAEIDALLTSDPKFGEYPFMHFYVQTNNSFERANFMCGAWEFMPIGNKPEPLMFVCGTGRGDGTYQVLGEFESEKPRLLTVNFIEE